MATIGATVTINGAELSGNKTTFASPLNRSTGGGIDHSGTLTITDSLLRRNRSQLGGALHARDGTAYLNRTITVSNVAAGGSGIWQQAGSLALLDVVLSGNGYEAPHIPRIPWSIKDAIDLWENSTIARECFGDAVHHHILTMAKGEWAAFNQTVTDWELRRYWERV